jgi:hypothetical protein
MAGGGSSRPWSCMRVCTIVIFFGLFHCADDVSVANGAI